MTQSEKTDKATPRPWNYQQERTDSYTHIIRTKAGEFIFQLPQDSIGKARANAELIVRAVNSHDELVDLLQDYVRDGHREPWYRRVTALLTKLND